jgi:flagellar basal body-associated protein FliL
MRESRPVTPEGLIVIILVVLLVLLLVGVLA